MIASHADRHTVHFKELVRVERLVESESIDVAEGYQMKVKVHREMIKNDSTYIDALTKVGVGVLDTTPTTKVPPHSQNNIKSHSLLGESGDVLMDEAKASVKRLKRYIKNNDVRVDDEMVGDIVEHTLVIGDDGLTENERHHNVVNSKGGDSEVIEVESEVVDELVDKEN